MCILNQHTFTVIAILAFRTEDGVEIIFGDHPLLPQKLFIEVNLT